MENLYFKEGIEITHFDNMSTSTTYLLSYKGRHWKVSSFVVNVFESIVRTNEKNKAYALVCEKMRKNISRQKFEQVVTFFFKQGLFVGCEDVITDKGRNKNLWCRFELIPANFVNKLRFLSVLYKDRFMLLIGLLEVIIISWFCAMYDLNVIYTDFLHLQPLELICGIGIIVVLGIIHEFGHAVALMHSNEKTGSIGMGIYLYMPVFYCNVTNAWKLRRKQRMIVDVGGIYLQAFAISIMAFCTTFIVANSAIKLAIIISAMQIIGNFNPFIRMDGYWLACDFLGVSNPYEIIKQEIKNIFRKNKVKTEFTDMKKGYQKLFFLYAAAICIYFLYFIRLIGYLMVNAIIQIKTDLVSFHIETLRGLSVETVFCYVRSRLTMYLVVLFVIRLLFILGKKMRNGRI